MWSELGGEKVKMILLAKVSRTIEEENKGWLHGLGCILSRARAVIDEIRLRRDCGSLACHNQWPTVARVDLK